MRVLQICNGFDGSKVHANLFSILDKLGVEQTIFTPVYTKDDIKKNRFDAERTTFIAPDILRTWYRLFFHLKKWIVTKNLMKSVDTTQYDLINATSLITDGCQAYELHKKYNIPYIVAVRNTDINLFLVKTPYVWGLAHKIMLNASKIVFISEATRQMFKVNNVVQPLLSQIESKLIVQPNGIDSYWHQHISNNEKTGHNILYVGDFGRNKNVVRLIQAVLELRKEPLFRDIHLNLVGKLSFRHETLFNNDKSGEIIEKLVKENPDTITCLGPIYDKDKLREVYAQNDMFAMPSITETFGLVYIEALSQNLPVLYTKNQGIDGMFDETVGVGVNPLSVEEIKGAIAKILTHQANYSNAQVHFEDFDWNNIAKRYVEMYKKVLYNK